MKRLKLERDFTTDETVHELISLLQSYDSSDNNEIPTKDKMRIEALCARIADRNVHL